MLTQRQQEVFNLLLQRNSTNEIAKILYIDPKTVRNHISAVINHFGYKNRGNRNGVARRMAIKKYKELYK